MRNHSFILTLTLKLFISLFIQFCWHVWILSMVAQTVGCGQLRSSIYIRCKLQTSSYRFHTIYHTNHTILPKSHTIFHYLRCLTCQRLPSLHSYSSVFFKHGLWHDRNTRHIFGSLKCRSGRGVGCVSIVCKLSYRLFLRPTLTLSHIIFNVFQT